MAGWHQKLSKQQIVYIVLCIFTIVIFLISLDYIDLRKPATYSHIRRWIYEDNPITDKTAEVKPTTARLTIPVTQKSLTTRKTSTLRPSTSTQSVSTTSGQRTSTTFTPTVSTSTISSVIGNSSPTAKVYTKIALSSEYPSHLNPESLSKMSLGDLREKCKTYDVASFKNPKIIHQSWKVKTLPPRFIKWSQSWKQCYPDWKYILWSDKDNDLFVKESFPWFYNRYKRLTHGVQKADAVRYMYLFTYGGVYADLDDECLKPFQNLLDGHSVVFGAMSGSWFPKNHIGHLPEGYVQNSFMYSVPGHPLWLDVLETIMSRPPSHSAESTTGPFMLQEVIGKWRKKNNSMKVKIYPPNFFNPFSWINRKYTDCKDVGSMSRKEVEKCKAHYPMAYVIQYHTQTWGRGAGNTYRKDR